MLRNDDKIVGILQKKQYLFVNILCIVMTTYTVYGDLLVWQHKPELSSQSDQGLNLYPASLMCA